MAPTNGQLIDRVCLMAGLARTLAMSACSAVVTEDNSGASFATETTDANDIGTNDVTLPDPFDSSDALYVAYSSTFSGLSIDVNTAGVGDSVAAEITWEYFDGTLWQALQNVDDNTVGLTVAGVNIVSFDPPEDWGTTTINSLGAYYWIRMRATANDVWNTTQPTISTISIRVGGLDRTLATSFLQQAAQQICNDVGLQVTLEASVTLTASDSTYTLDSSPFPTDMVRLLDVSITDSANTLIPVDRISMREMQTLRQGTPSNGTPMVYAVDYPNFVIFPPPGSGTTAKVTYQADAPTIRDDATEITFLPAWAAWGCLERYAEALAMRYKNKHELAREIMMDFFKDRHAGLPALKRWKAVSGGRQLGDLESLGGRVQYSPSQDLGGL